MSFLRALIPSWSFFDQVAPRVTLHYKIKGSTAWMLALKPPKRKLLNLILNPQGNLYLAEQGLVERLIYDIHNSDPLTVSETIRSTVSYQLVLNLIKMRLRQKRLPHGSFQFKITVETPDEIYDVITSNEHEL